MEAQLALLRAMRDGEEPASPENIAKAFNREVLTEIAVANQNASVENTSSSLAHEIDRTNTALTRRQHQIARLRHALESEPEIAKPPDLENLRHVVLRLSDGYLSQLGLGDPQEISQILWRLVEVTSRNEQLVVPADLRLIQFLIDEGLVKSEPVGLHKLRIKLY